MRRRELLLGSMVLAIGLLLMMGIQLTGAAKGDLVRITVDGQVFGTYDLNTDQEISISNGEDENLVRIREGKVYMEEANCPDAYCIQQGSISGKTQTIVCLPHKLVVEVIPSNENAAEEGRELPDTVTK